MLQSDTFFQHLTPREQLTFTALLRLGGKAYPTRASKLAVVDRMIALLGLGKCEQTPIMFLSGGTDARRSQATGSAGMQRRIALFGLDARLTVCPFMFVAYCCAAGERKRVNIGTELLTDPPLLLLDEPLSGLDASGANSLMKTLRDLANGGMTIITSIHQPSSQLFHSFDLLYLVCDGHTVYSGPPSGALHHFNSLGFKCPDGYSIADHVMDVANQEDAKKVLIEAAQHKKLESGSGSQDQLSPLSHSGVESVVGVSDSKWATGFFEQFVVLYKRSFTKAWGEIFKPLAVKQCLALAVITGLFWLQMENNEKSIPDRSSFVFFALTFWVRAHACTRTAAAGNARVAPAICALVLGLIFLRVSPCLVVLLVLAYERFVHFFDVVPDGARRDQQGARGGHVSPFFVLLGQECCDRPVDPGPSHRVLDHQLLDERHQQLLPDVPGLPDLRADRRAGRGEHRIVSGGRHS